MENKSPFSVLLPTILFVLTFFAANRVLGQSPNACFSLDCNGGSGIFDSEFRVQVIPDPNYSNVTAGCPTGTSTPCGNGDQFRQLFFKVRLLYSTNSTSEYQNLGNLNFDLNYQRLLLTTLLKSSNTLTGKGLSFIDKNATAQCYSNTANTNGWTNTDAFAVTENDGQVEFENAFANQCPENIIHFTPLSSCPLSSYLYCAYADIFTVVVNAYAGETVRLEASGIYQREGEGSCDMNHIDGEITTLLPNLPLPGSTNDNLEIRLLDQVPTSNGGCTVGIEVVNNNNFGVTTNYLEFIAKIVIPSYAGPLEVSGDYDRPVLVSGTDHFIHFIIYDTWVLAANGGTHFISAITIPPPTLSNSDWITTISLEESGKSRVRSSTGCTALPLSEDAQVCEIFGDVPCVNADNIFFTLRGVLPDPNDCQIKKINAGFYTDLSGFVNMNLSHLEFKLRFEVTGDLQITGINYPGTPWSNCPSANTCLQSCFETEVDPNDPNYILFHYCMALSVGGMPLYLDPDAFIEIVFEGNGCVQSSDITFLRIKRTSDNGFCIPAYELPPYAGFSVCPTQIYGTIATETGNRVNNVTVGMELSSAIQPSTCTVSCYEEMNTGNDGYGSYGFCPCSDCRYFVVTPEYNKNPLNGVSTFDLVLINRHLLGLQPLSSPYKMIAADANKSNSVTVFDVTEIRKLILGVFSDFPSNTSWRFVPEQYNFPTPNPFINLPLTIGSVEVDKTANGGSNEENYVAIKVGDVNNTASTRPVERPLIHLSWPTTAQIVQNEVVTLPVTYTGTDTLEAIQLGFSFDPSKMALVSPSQGDLSGYSAANFGLGEAQSGKIRTLWLPSDLSDPEQRIMPGTVLFHLTFKVLGSLPESGLPLRLDNAVLDNAAWRFDGTEFVVVLEPVTGERITASQIPPALHASVRPNPVSGEVIFQVESTKSGKGRIALFGPFGNRVFARDVVLDADEQEFVVPEVAQLPAGVYIWKVYSNGEKVQGHLVKQ